MGFLWDNHTVILDAFGEGLILSGWAALFALVTGTLLAVMRVSPVPPLRWTGTAYVSVLRNTPLVLCFMVFTSAIPHLGFTAEPLTWAIWALSAYTAAFVCEAVRAGIMSVPRGQAEAARAVGMTFGQSMRLVILPQALRAAVPPLGNTMIAMWKNSTVAAGFGVAEGAGALHDLLNEYADKIWTLFIGIAVGYMVVVFVISAVFRLIERTWRYA
ncbi:amino acid ABC transporter permease [Catenulispora yoronensis]|uniref:Amino acid ABC transporter permease n=1 Tax=Catenulispora yoronensis TaxID=450799 RepID=A0ABN2TJ19_9ACTN